MDGKRVFNQLFMVDIVGGENVEQDQLENNEIRGNQLKEVELKTQNKILSKKQKHLWDTQMYLQMIKEAQAVVDKEDGHEDSSSDEKDCEWVHSKHMDIWNDEQTMKC
jgi:hypothetical protein